MQAGPAEPPVLSHSTPGIDSEGSMKVRLAAGLVDGVPGTQTVSAVVSIIDGHR